MKISPKRIFIKLFKITGISIGSILLLLFLLPIVFPGTIGDKIKSWTNKSIDGELNFSKVRLSFFTHFPSFTLSLYDFSLKGSAPFKNDTLVSADKISFGINLKSLLFDKKINIDKIFLSDAYMHVKVNEKGEANYNVYISDKKQQQAVTDSTNTTLKLEKISIENSHLIYDDRSVDVLLDAKGFNYNGNGNLSEAIFDLYSRADIDSLDFYFAKEPYLLNKKVNADLITKVNTNSLSILFQQNKLLINKLPVQFNGKLDFLKNGYDIDFTVVSTNSKLDDFVTALPPQYITWQKSTSIKGTTDLLVKLKGKYIAAENSMPDLNFNMTIRDGFVKHENAPFPATNLYLNLQTRMPSINPDSLEVKVDSVFFNVNKDFIGAVIKTKGIKNPFITINANAAIDLEQMDRALGLSLVDLKGRCNLRFTTDGQYATGPNPTSIRHENTILKTPVFNMVAAVKGGYFKYTSLPLPVTNINFDFAAANTTNDYQNSNLKISNLSANALSNFIKGNFGISNLKSFETDADLQAMINLNDLKNIFPVKGFDVKGILKATIKARGKYDAAAKTFPVTTADISLKGGSLKTPYYPNPINKIEAEVLINNNGGTLKDLEVKIQPASFQFEGKPFAVKALFKNFENIAYNIKANGELDIAKIYKVFSQKGIDVTGFIKADVQLQGTQSAALNKEFSKLNNQGTLELKDIATTTEMLPYPFIIKDGLFTFKQDKMWFKNFHAVYGSSGINMNGYLQNVIEYALADKAVLKGDFKLESAYINTDELMLYGAKSADTSAIKKDTSAAVTGVIVIPANLDLVIDANVQKADFNGVHFNKAKGNLSVKNGVLHLQKTGFNLIGSETIADATYANEGLNKARFDFNIDAKDFDVKKAYDSIKLFRDAATAAGKAQGVISLVYALKGKLDGNMHPIYPSLEGGGTLSVKKVKVKGFKLFTAVSRKTGKDSIANPDMSKVDIKSTIKNNLIKLERFKIKMAGFRLRMEGQTSFDGRLNLKMRLGLPPLGIIGIPMRVKGTQDNPSIKLGKDKEELEETEYKEDENGQR